MVIDCSAVSDLSYFGFSFSLYPRTPPSHIDHGNPLCNRASKNLGNGRKVRQKHHGVEGNEQTDQHAREAAESTDHRKRESQSGSPKEKTHRKGTLIMEGRRY